MRTRAGRPVALDRPHVPAPVHGRLRPARLQPTKRPFAGRHQRGQLHVTVGRHGELLIVVDHLVIVLEKRVPLRPVTRQVCPVIGGGGGSGGGVGVVLALVQGEVERRERDLNRRDTNVMRVIVRHDIGLISLMIYTHSRVYTSTTPGS